MLPGDLLALVFILLRLESEFDEDLLQFFVDKVNTELLKPVFLE